MTEAPTAEQLLEEEGLKSVHKDLDDSWRHGNRVTEVFHRESDNTYWSAHYKQSGDGEYNGLRDDDYTVHQVEPFEKTVIDYRAIKQEEQAA